MIYFILINYSNSPAAFIGHPSSRMTYSFHKTEDILGNYIGQISQQSMKAAKLVERNLTIKNVPKLEQKKILKGT